MSFLAPIFLVGLAAVAVPILVHLIQRERRTVVEFPSLMFVRRIPYESSERRRIHNWPLLLLRLAALAAIVTAFARPFATVDPVAAAVTGDREVVVLLDRSASMGYGDRWSRAQAEARRVIDGLDTGDRATLVLFDDTPEETVRATADHGTLRAAVDNAAVSSGATRFAPALRLAQSRLATSGGARQDVFLITDFQRSGWARQEDVQWPEGATFTPIAIADEATESVAATGVVLEREAFSGAERVTVTAALANRGNSAVSRLDVALEIDGRVVERRDVDIAPESTTAVSFEPVTVSESNVQAVIRAGTDKLPQDNAFYFVLSPSRPVSVLVVQGDETPAAAGRFLSTALDLGREPAFRSEIVSSARLTPAQLEGRSVVVVNDAALGSAAAALLTSFVERGGGLFLVLGDRSPAGADWPLLPGALSAPVDRLAVRGGSFGYVDYSHPALDEFRDPRNGSLTGMRFLRYRGLRPTADDRVLARFDDGAAAMVERRVGSGRVIAFASTLDGTWNDVPRHAMYLPLVHEVTAYLAQYEVPAAWQTVGRMFDVSSPVSALVRDGQLGADGVRGVRGVVLTPSGRQLTIGDGGAESFALAEQGFYSVRLAGTGSRRPYVVAVNLSPEESDLTAMTPDAFLATMSGSGRSVATTREIEPLTPAEMEKRQSVWWFLLVAGLIALLAEAALSNRLSRRVVPSPTAR
ncbi:MAG: hypothetical protein ABS36_14065 [Acidobacteria bacterium SCN 69-37]|nr:MAG: hypothetical protein ABS36_14065 [Acidobacteria bacterium SCN 69-37]